MTLVILSILVLFAAPLVTRFLRPRPVLSSGFDGFVLILAFGLVMLVILPEVLSHLGGIGIVVMMVGFLLPSIAEQLLRRSAHQTHQISLMIAVFALVLHSGADGLLLAKKQVFGAASLWVGLSVLLHRFAVGTTLWWLLRPYFSWAMRFTVIIAMSLSTLLFYLLADQWATFGMYKELIDAMLAFASGGLLHIVLHPHETGTATTNPLLLKRSHQLGTALGLAFVAVMVAMHADAHAPATAPFFVHNNLHGIDALLVAAFNLSPWFLGVLAIWIVYAVAAKSGGIGRALISATKLSLLLWFGAGLALFWLPDIAHSFEQTHFSVSVLLWAATVGVVLTRLGARDFLSGIMPSALLHARHDHH